jgi:hypothetical protein
MDSKVKNMLDFHCIANQIIELTHQSWIFDKNTSCTAGKDFPQDRFINHTPTKAVMLLLTPANAPISRDFS